MSTGSLVRDWSGAARRLLAPLALALAPLGVAVGSASASTWTAAAIPDGPVTAGFYGVSCPTTSMCVAVGGNTSIAASTDPGGGAKAWSVVHPGGSVDLPFDGVGTYGGGQIKGISCPSTGLCVAASFEGDLYSSTTPTGSASAWKVVPLAGENEPNVHMGGISCPSPSLCVAAAYGGKIVYSTDPTGDRLAWNVVELPQRFDFRGIACPSVSLCVAVANEGAIVASTDPTGGPDAWQSAGAPAGENSLNGIGCPSISLCVTGNAGQIISATNPAGGPGSWKVVSAGSGLPIKGVSCPLTTACAAVDNNSGVNVSDEPTGGAAAWSFKTVIPFGHEDGEGNGMFAISCPSTSLCVAAGQNHQIISSTDPFVPDAVVPVRRSKRPRVVITRHPAKRIDPRKGGVKVSFRFHATAKVVRFKCKIRGRGARTCKSPMRYRVGRGEHVFVVRAVAPGGAKGPRTSFHFRVGPLEERPPAGSCPKGAPPGAPCVNGVFPLGLNRSHSTSQCSLPTGDRNPALRGDGALARGRPTSILGVSGESLQNSVESFSFAEPCKRQGERIWICQAYGSGASDGVPYRVAVRRLGCWTAIRVGISGEGSDRRLAGCVTALDYVV